MNRHCCIVVEPMAAAAGEQLKKYTAKAQRLGGSCRSTPSALGCPSACGPVIWDSHFEMEACF